MTDRDIIEQLNPIIGFGDDGPRVLSAALLIEVRDTIERLTAREQAAREFVKRHPALTLIDLAEFESFLKMPETLAALSDGGGK